MAGHPIAKTTQAKILRRVAKGMSDRHIATELGINQTTVLRYRRDGGQDLAKQKASAMAALEGARQAARQAARSSEPIRHEAIRKLLRKGPLSTAELAQALDTTAKRTTQALAEMRARGGMLLRTVDGKHDLGDSIVLPVGAGVARGQRGEWQHVFGFTTDNHLCNKHARLDVLKAAYDHFEREGITRVFNAGNWIDGEARFNKTELLTAPGMDNQLDYMIDNFPHHRGIVTDYIAGDDHEGWYQQREGIEVGRYLQMKAEGQGRNDLKYLGYGEADVKLQYGDGSAVMRVVHPGGGSSYAISYTDQKRVESYQGGEKPQLELVGHYHKFNHGFPREVHTIQGGCTVDQTMFMRKKRLQAHVGYTIIKIAQASDGAVNRVGCEWFPFFDRGFYEKRFALAGNV